MHAASARSSTQDQELLEAARGDEDSFRRFVEPRLAELHAHCYRMLGSLHDADDALQDALLRAWRGLRRFEGRGAPRSWLYRIATNACLDAIARRPKRLVPIDDCPVAGPGDDAGAPLGDPSRMEPYPDQQLGGGFAAPEASYEQRESVELAFIVALQRLPASQRAVLILREVLGFSAREVAETLELTPVAVNSALQRARKAVDERLPDRSQQATLRSLGDKRIRELVEGFVDAWDKGDVDAMVAMLVEEPTFAMPHSGTRHRGREAISAFLPAGPPGRWRLVPARANGQLAFGAYRWDPRTRSHRAALLDVLALRGGKIAEVTAFAVPGAFRRFGLPDGLPG